MNKSLIIAITALVISIISIYFVFAGLEVHYNHSTDMEPESVFCYDK